MGSPRHRPCPSPHSRVLESFIFFQRHFWNESERGYRVEPLPAANRQFKMCLPKRTAALRVAPNMAR